MSIPKTLLPSFTFAFNTPLSMRPLFASRPVLVSRSEFQLSPLTSKTYEHPTTRRTFFTLSDPWKRNREGVYSFDNSIYFQFADGMNQHLMTMHMSASLFNGWINPELGPVPQDFRHPDKNRYLDQDQLEELLRKKGIIKDE